MKKWKKRKKMMKKYHQQNLVEHEADSAVRECRTQSLSKLVGVHDQDRRMVWLWAAWATTGKSNFGLRAAYAKLTRSLRGCAGTTTQKPVRLCQVRIHHTSDTPKNLMKKKHSKWAYATLTTAMLAKNAYAGLRPPVFCLRHRSLQGSQY